MYACLCLHNDFKNNYSVVYNSWLFVIFEHIPKSLKIYEATDETAYATS